jgi:predicted DNA-binding transcriptional regulator YafY
MNKSSNFNAVIDEIIIFLNSLKNKNISEDIKGLVQKLGDTIQISRLISEKSNEIDFIDFEKVPETWGSDFLPSLIKAIQNKTVVEIYYHPFYEDKPYFIRVHPYLLKEYLHRWYLIGLSETKMELRTFGLDRILELKETSLPYISRTFNAKEYFRHTIGVISPSGPPPKIRIEVLKPQAQYLITQPFHPSQSIESEDPSSITFNYRIHPTYEFKVLLLGLGSDLKILEPLNLRNEILKELKGAIKRYEENDN